MLEYNEERPHDSPERPHTCESPNHKPPFGELSRPTRPLTNPLQSLPSRIATGSFGRLCRGLDYVEPRPASCANRPPGAEGAELDLYIT
jgi:hypothetical protein